ncbi:MAG: class I SAM-dependent methyltransferase [Acidimicrobiales bacterium]
MARTRYDLAVAHSKRMAVLEIACGAGWGLDYLSDYAALLAGGDLESTNLDIARSRVPGANLLQFHPHSLPFRAESFDTVLIFEALYDFGDVGRSMSECVRILRSGGHLLLAVANPDRRGFHPRPRGVRHLNSEGLRLLLEVSGFEASMFGAYRSAPRTMRERLRLPTTGLAQQADVARRSRRGNTRIKSLIYGPMSTFEGLRTSDVPGEVPVPLDGSRAASSFKNLYAVARKRPDQ